MASYKKPIGENLLSTKTDLTEGMNDRVKKYQQTLDEILQANDVACSFMDVKCLPLSIIFKYKIESFTFKKSVLTEIEEMLPVYLNCQEASIEFINSEMAFAIRISNDERPSMPLGNLLQTEEYTKLEGNTKFVLGIGKDSKPIIMDLLKSNNILILGDDETEKINMLKTILTSILANAQLNTVQLEIFDSKKKSLEMYSRCKNFLMNYYTKDHEDEDEYVGCRELKYINAEWWGRSEDMHAKGTYNFIDYNEKLGWKNKVSPYIIVVINSIEELIDIGSRWSDARKRELESLGRKGNGAGKGIYLICTAKDLNIGIPAKDIRDMFATRITFKKTEDYEDRGLNITYQSKLLGNGDGLYFSYKDNRFNSFQAAAVTDDDIELLVEYIETEAVQP